MHYTGGAYSAPPDPLAVFRGPTSKRRGGRKEARKGRGEKGERSTKEYLASLLFFACFHFLIFHLFSRGSVDPICPYVQTPMERRRGEKGRKGRRE